MPRAGQNLITQPPPEGASICLQRREDRINGRRSLPLLAASATSKNRASGEKKRKLGFGARVGRSRSDWLGSGSRRHIPMIRIAITQATFDAIAATMPLGSIGYEAQLDAQGQRLIWIELHVLNRRRAPHGPGESYSDVIIRLTAVGHESLNRS
jgi:hypothetical protein